MMQHYLSEEKCRIKSVIQEIHVYLIIIILKIENLLLVSPEVTGSEQYIPRMLFIERGVDFSLPPESRGRRVVKYLP